MIKVLAFGTFDMFHPGHKFYLTEAKKLGDKLEVVIARDSTVRKVKGRNVVNNEDKRLKVIESLDIVDNAYLGSKKDVYNILGKIKPDIICLGYDQTSFTGNLKEKLKEKKLKTKVVRIKSFKPDKYKSSKLNNLEYMKGGEENGI